MSQFHAVSGPTDAITDLMGIKVGNAHDAVVNTGVTAIIPDCPVAMGVDVRGGGPGTRDTDALDPTCMIEKVHGLVLAGGSVFGLAAADGVASFLSQKGIGLAISPVAVPVVPSAILFDLRNGGNKNWGDLPPYRDLGLKAAQAAAPSVSSGRVGAGYGATAGAAQGGLGTASLQLDNGITVGAIVAVNSFGSVTESHNHGVVDLPKLGFAGANTTIAAIATNVPLDKAGCKRLAMMAQDGLARAIRPIHTPFDGDTVFAMSTGAAETDIDPGVLMAVIGTLAADCLEVAIRKAVLAVD
jgi:L-aminopeptidase/D-esterase-like protein